MFSSIDQSKLQRSLSFYDNVDVNESIEAANRLSGIDMTKESLHSRRPNSRESRKSPIAINQEISSSVENEIKLTSETETKTLSTIDSTNLSIETDSTSNKINSTTNLKSSAEEVSDIIEENRFEYIDKTYEITNSNTFSFSTTSKYIDFERNSNETEFVQAWPDSTDNACLSSLTILPIISDNTNNHQLIKESSDKLFFEFERIETIENNSNQIISDSSILNANNQNSSSIKTVIEKEELSIQKNDLKNESIESKSSKESKFQNNKTEVINGAIGSRTSPMRTPWKKGSEKRQGMVMLSPTSPTAKPSLIPRYIATNHATNNTSLSSSSFKPQLRYESNSQIKSSFVKSRSTSDESTKLRIFVPYHYEDKANNDSNKIQLRVDSPTLQLKQNDSNCLPAVDT